MLLREVHVATHTKANHFSIVLVVEGVPLRRSTIRAPIQRQQGAHSANSRPRLVLADIIHYHIIKQRARD